MTSTRDNYFICDAARRNQPIFSAYQHLCRLHSNRVIDYVDFEWKYYQYYHGSSDLNMELSPDSKSPVTFEDLPVDILGKVVGKLTLLDCLTLRKVTPDLQNLVDSSELQCDSIGFCFRDDLITMSFNSLELKYEGTRDGGCEVTAYRKDTKETKKYWDNRNFKQVMIADSSAFLKNRKLKIGQIEFKWSDEAYSDESMAEFLEFLRSQNFPLNVRSIRLHGENCLPILQLLQPENLEEIILEGIYFSTDEFSYVEQWKAKTRLRHCDFPEGTGLEQLVHFKQIQTYDFEIIDDDRNLMNIRDVLVKSPHFESCDLIRFWDDDEVPDELGTLERIDRIMSEDPTYDVRTHRFSIPDSSDYFQLEFKKLGYDNILTITKISND